jgi:2-polyprenyl-6-methoxyphenol hydroxylase-like FAD-dependent oxidoreductase
MTTSTQTDVIIVGAGPTGLSLACQLIRYGVDFVIVEKNEAITPFSKALGVQARTLEIYEQIDLAKPALERGTIAGKVRMIEGGNIVGEVDLSNIGKGLSAYPFLLVLEQSENERLLYDYVKRHLQDVDWHCELEGFSQNESSVVAQVTTSNGETRTITGKYLVGCDGPRSPVRHGLGLAFEGSTFERLFYVADVRIDWKFSHDALHVCIAEHGLVAFFPMPGEKRWRIVGDFPEGHDKDPSEIPFEEIEARIKSEAEIDLDITRVDWFSTYKIHTRHVEKFSSGRCFLAGDAAHIHTPAGGQGMNTGIQDAYNLAWKLALVLKGAAAPRLVDSYNEERLPNAKRLLQTTDRMFNLAAGTDWLVNLIRTTIFPPMAKFILSIDAVKKKFFPLVSQIGISYRDSSLSSHDTGGEDFEVRAGDRLPYFLLEGNSIFDKLREPKFHLIAFSDGSDTANPDQQKLRDEIDARYPNLIDYYEVPLNPTVAEIFGTSKSFQVLLRPDNYIAYISADTSPRLALDYLAGLAT